MKRRNWTREELILALNLYCTIPFGKLHSKNPDIIKLANIINRTPSAVAWKACNFAALDESLNRKGASNFGKLDKEIWNEFNSSREKMFFECENMLAKYLNKPLEEIAEIEPKSIPKGKTEREQFVRTRVNQKFFRDTILSSYDFKCCITGLNIPQLLIASHIVPWAVDKDNRLNPRNGLCLNALHDKAFDVGLITVTEDLKVEVSRQVKQGKVESSFQKLILDYEGCKITSPRRFKPDMQFIKYHQQEVFEKNCRFEM